MNPELRLLHLSFLFFVLNAQNMYRQCTAADKKQVSAPFLLPSTSAKGTCSRLTIYTLQELLSVTESQGWKGLKVLAPTSCLHQSSVTPYRWLSRLYVKASSKKESVALFSGGFTTIIFEKFFLILSELSPLQFKPIFVLPIFISNLL